MRDTPAAELAANQRVVRVGKGNKDRVTMLPAMVKARLVRHMERLRTSFLAFGSVGCPRVNAGVRPSVIFNIDDGVSRQSRVPEDPVGFL